MIQRRFFTVLLLVISGLTLILFPFKSERVRMYSYSRMTGEEPSLSDSFKLNSSYDRPNLNLIEDLENCGTNSDKYYLKESIEDEVPRFTGNCWDCGTDLDGDGKFNRLTITTEIQTPNFPQYYESTFKYVDLYAKLDYQDHIGLLASNKEDFALYEGLQNISFNFEVDSFFFRLKHSGVSSISFSFASIQLDGYEFHGSTTLIYDQNDLSYRTNTYSREDFDQDILLINSHRAFELIASAERWSGTGTIDNPFLIEELVLNRSVLEIRDLSDYFYIRKCKFYEGRPSIRLYNVENAYLDGNLFSDIEVGVSVENSYNIHFFNNTLNSAVGWIGIETTDLREISIINNTFKGFKLSSIELKETKDAIIQKNVISESNYGVRVLSCSDVTLESNLVYDNQVGVHISSTFGTTPIFSVNIRITNNTICVNSGYAIYLSSYADQVSILMNDIFGNNPGKAHQAYNNGYQNEFSQNFWNTSQDIDYIYGNRDYDPNFSPNNFYQPIVIQPNGGENVSGSFEIKWSHAVKIFNQEVVYSIYCSSDRGDNWIFLESLIFPRNFSSDAEELSYDWKINRTKFPPGSNYVIRVIAENQFGFLSTDNSDSFFTIGLKEDAFTIFGSNIQGIILLVIIIGLVFIVQVRSRRI